MTTSCKPSTSQVLVTVESHYVAFALCAVWLDQPNSATGLPTASCLIYRSTNLRRLRRLSDTRHKTNQANYPFHGRMLWQLARPQCHCSGVDAAYPQAPADLYAGSSM